MSRFRWFAFALALVLAMLLAVALGTIALSPTQVWNALLGRGDTAANSVNVYIQFNTDTGNNYNWSQVTSGGNFGANGTNQPPFCGLTAASNAASWPGACRMLIPGYAGTTFNKIGITHGGDRNANPGDSSYSTEISWSNTAAITQVLLGTAAGNFTAGTTAILYGYN